MSTSVPTAIGSTLGWTLTTLLPEVPAPARANQSPVTKADGSVLWVVGWANIASYYPSGQVNATDDLGAKVNQAVADGYRAIFIPPGDYKLATKPGGWGNSPAGPQVQAIVQGSGSASKILVAVGQTGYGWAFANTRETILRDLAFIGNGVTTSPTYDCKVLFDLGSNTSVCLERIRVSGVGYKENLIQMYNGGMSLRDCFFGGTGGDNSVVKIGHYTYGWGDVQVEDCKFWDYDDLGGVHHQKISASTFLPPAAIQVSRPYGAVVNMNAGSFTARRVLTDENFYHGIYIGDAAERIGQAIRIIDCKANIGTADYSSNPVYFNEKRCGVYARGVDSLLVEDGWAGYTAATEHHAVKVVDCGRVRLDRLDADLAHNVLDVSADSLTQWLEIEDDSRIPILNSSAVQTIRSKKGARSAARYANTSSLPAAGTVAPGTVALLTDTEKQVHTNAAGTAWYDAMGNAL